jgi:hypothetical protein
VLIVAYAFGEPYMEKWLGVDLPSIREESRQASTDIGNDARTANATERAASRQLQIRTPVAKQPDNDSPASQNSTQNGQDVRSGSKPAESHGYLGDQPNTSKRITGIVVDRSGSKFQSEKRNADRAGDEEAKSKSYLKPLGQKDRLQSPAGLVYGRGGSGEHRLDHVMRHATDNPSRPLHSVFDGDQVAILKAIDEAYELIKAKSHRVRSQADDRLDFRVEHVVDMKRRIGYLGGQRGKRENYPPRSKLTLILDNDKFVVTAYPDH